MRLSSTLQSATAAHILSLVLQFTISEARSQFVRYSEGENLTLTLSSILRHALLSIWLFPNLMEHVPLPPDNFETGLVQDLSK